MCRHAHIFSLNQSLFATQHVFFNPYSTRRVPHPHPHPPYCISAIPQNTAHVTQQSQSMPPNLPGTITADSLRQAKPLWRTWDEKVALNIQHCNSHVPAGAKPRRTKDETRPACNQYSVTGEKRRDAMHGILGFGREVSRQLEGQQATWYALMQRSRR
jgi:hypothetical protein